MREGVVVRLANYPLLIAKEGTERPIDDRRKVMLLNACCIHKPGNCSELILLAIEDISDRKRARGFHEEQAICSI